MSLISKASLPFALVAVRCLSGRSVLAADLPVAALSPGAVGPLASSPVPQMPITVSPLTGAQLKDPKAALTAVRKVVGADILQKAGGFYVTGFAQIQGKSLPFTSATDLRTGFNRTIILLPHNAGTYEFGIDKDGGWSAVAGRLRLVSVSSENLVTARYVDRFGFLDPSQPVGLKEVGVDPSIGDRITIAPAGGAKFLAIIKPATSLPSAVQLGNGQVSIYADYRLVGGALFPYRIMQGVDAKAMSVFQASNVELVVDSPDTGAISRPLLPVDASTPSAPPTPSGTK